ncbi:MAG TPA: sigma-70 family RNA polymerase sigma factor [Rhizomicrobium sp.]|nr:sigma-70 family RNA polymerase sigma factor [Rhizomicrobium sp.]
MVLQLFPKLAMNRPAEVAQMDALLGRVAATQDRAAFAALFAHFAPRVKAYLLRLGAPSGVAEELAQEALLSVWRKAHLFDPAKASAATWLFTIARNLRIDAIRRERRPELDPEDFMPEPDTDADAGLMLAENEGRLRLALKELPADQIQVVELSFFADKPHSQIALELGIPLGTVKSRLRLAMGRLKRAMGGEE